MDILVQKPIFSNSVYYEPPSSVVYTPYSTPPYIIQPVAGSWLSEQQLPQMQYIRFPTPPITPPRVAATADAASVSRTQSVIMKCPTSGSGSGSGSPTHTSCSDQSGSSSCSDCDFICNWHECSR